MRNMTFGLSRRLEGEKFEIVNPKQNSGDCLNIFNAYRVISGDMEFILHVMIGMLSSPLMQSEIIIYELVRKCVMPSPFSQTIFI